MKRDFLKSLGITDEAVLDQIMQENGNDINREKQNAPKAPDDYEAIKAELGTLKQEREANLAQIKLHNIEGRMTTVLGQKKFVNDYTRGAVLKEFSEALDKPENAGKADTAIFEEIAKGRDGLFASSHGSYQGGEDLQMGGAGRGGIDASTNADNQNYLNQQYAGNPWYHPQNG